MFWMYPVYLYVTGILLEIAPCNEGNTGQLCWTHITSATETERGRGGLKEWWHSCPTSTKSWMSTLTQNVCYLRHDFSLSLVQEQYRPKPYLQGTSITWGPKVICNNCRGRLSWSCVNLPRPYSSSKNINILCQTQRSSDNNSLMQTGISVTWGHIQVFSFLQVSFLPLSRLKIMEDAVAIMTSAKEVMFLPALVCLSVCLQNNSKIGIGIINWRPLSHRRSSNRTILFSPHVLVPRFSYRVSSLLAVILLSGTGSCRPRPRMSLSKTEAAAQRKRGFA